MKACAADRRGRASPPDCARFTPTALHSSFGGRNRRWRDRCGASGAKPLSRNVNGQMADFAFDRDHAAAARVDRGSNSHANDQALNLEDGFSQVAKSPSQQSRAFTG